MGAYDLEGKLVARQIKENIKKNITGVNVENENVDSFPIKVTLNNGHKYQVSKDGQIMMALNAGDTAPSDSNAVYTSGEYTAIIPAGFTVSDIEGENHIETGLVIRDNEGNEFVWIPVGIQWKSDSTKIITLNRYTFDENGNPISQGSNTIDGYNSELTNSSYGNAVAKTDITSENGFIAKTNAAGGFWIGRYEARVEGYTGNVITSNSNKDISWTGYANGKLVEKPGAQVFNYITQNKAAELSRTMYNLNNYFESDLMNSYAWDTASLFLQEYDNRTSAVKSNTNYKLKYSMQISLSSGLKNTGTNASTVSENNKDKICNVYDMADNCVEWTTESSSYIDVWEHTNWPCILRGGLYNQTFHCTYRKIL